MLVSHETLREVALYHRVSIRVVHSIVERVKKKTLFLKELVSDREERQKRRERLSKHI